MAQETPNHAYNRPKKGEQDWGQPLNTNFADIDADIEVRDVAANRSNYDPQQGAKFLATDTGIVSTGDGSSWSEAFALARYDTPSTPDSVGSVVLGHASNGTGGNSWSGATVGGGENNTASNTNATVGGGSGNTANSLSTTVAGGASNTAGDNYATVCGGFNNTADALGATIPGGGGNTASGLSSFAAGRAAKAQHNGTFVWADSSSTDISSTGADQFLIEASGGVGIGTNSPTGQRLDVEGDVATSGDFSRHVVTFTNTSGNSTGDVLGLRTQVSNPPSDMNFISFTDPNGQVGQIDGDGSGGVNYKSGSADLAEYFPTADPTASFASGDVVGLDGGELVADPTAADVALVVSDAPMVTGNAPLDDDGDGLTCVALLGQVPVRAGATVDPGDLLVATPDGTAVPRDDSDDHAPVVGRALEPGEAGDPIETFVNARTDAAATRLRTLEQRLSEKDDRIRELEASNEGLRDEVMELEAENETLRNRNDALEARLAAVEEHLGIDNATGRPTPADD